MEFDLKKTLLALLHSTNEPLSTKDVQAVITRYHDQAEQMLAEQEEEGSESGSADEDGQGIMRDLLEQVPSLLTSAQIRDTMESITEELKESESVFRLQEGPNGYRLSIAPRYADWVRLLRDEPRPQRLSPAAMETLSIVAYRQPVTRAEIEAIRGVSADSALNKLLERELVFVVGRAELPGRPLQYGTTDTFLEYCGIKSLEELPSSDVLSPNQITEWIRSATMPEEEISDKDVGLAEQTEEGMMVFGGEDDPQDTPSEEEQPEEEPAEEPEEEEEPAPEEDADEELEEEDSERK
jgi:segregation and condensation protein B